MTISLWKNKDRLAASFRLVGKTPEMVFVVFLVIFGLSFQVEAQNYIFRSDNQLSGYSSQIIVGNPQFKWRRQFASQTDTMPVSDSSKIVLSGGGKVYCLDSDSGREKWSAVISGLADAPASICRDSVLVCTDNSMVYRLSLESGEIIWEHKTGGKMAGSVNIWVKGDNIWLLAGCYDNKVYCLDFKDGEEKWQVQADNYVNGSISVSGDVAAFGSCDGFVYFLNIPGGKITNKFDTGAYVPGWPVIESGLCYSVNYQGRATAVTMADSTLKWEYKLEDGNALEGPAVGPKQMLFADEDGSLYCLDKNEGLELWKFKVDDKPLSPPVICGDKVFCCSENGWLYMLNLSDGKIAWKYLVGEELSESVYIHNGKLLFSDNSGRIYCFELK